MDWVCSLKKVFYNLIFSNSLLCLFIICPFKKVMASSQNLGFPIFSVTSGDVHLGNAFLLDSFIITNSHIAAALIYCPSNKINCDQKYLVLGRQRFEIVGIERNNPILDYAILLVPTLPVIESLTVSQLRADDLPQNESVQMISNTENGELVERTGVLKGYSQSLSIKPSFFYQMETSKGLSGSPILYKNKVIGIHWGGSGGIGKAIPISTIIKDITKGE